VHLQWQSASNGDDGFLSAGSTVREAVFSANNARAPIDQIQIRVDNDIPWLVPLGR
jgi:hypothetical protein